MTVKKSQGSLERIMWGMEEQITSRLAGEAHHTHKLSAAQFIEPSSGQPRPILFCTRCGVYTTSKAMGIRKQCTPPSFKEGKREKNPHRCQHGLEDMKEVAERSAKHDELPPGALNKQPRVPRGGTGTSLKTLLNGKHPQHKCDLTNIKPLSSKTRLALTQSERKPSEVEDESEKEDEGLAAEVFNQMQDISELELNGAEATQRRANFRSNMTELEELEQQALRAAGVDVAPEEEDMFRELALLVFS